MQHVHGTKKKKKLHFAHSDQSRTFTHLKTVLGTLMNACIEYDFIECMMLREQRAAVAITRKPSILRIDPQRTFSPV